MNQVVGYTGESSADLKEGIEKHRLEKALRLQAWTRKLGSKDRAEAYLESEKRRGQR